MTKKVKVTIQQSSSIQEKCSHLALLKSTTEEKIQCGRSKCTAEAATKLQVASVVKVVHVQLQVNHVGLLEMHSVPGGEAAAHCKITLDHPWHPGRGNPGRERGGGKNRKAEGERKQKSKGKKEREGGRRRDGNMRESVRLVQRWSALSYGAGDYRRCSVRRIHRLWCQQGQRVMETAR